MELPAPQGADYGDLTGHSVAANGRAACLGLLIAAKAGLDAKENDGRTAAKADFYAKSHAGLGAAMPAAGQCSPKGLPSGKAASQVEWGGDL